MIKKILSDKPSYLQIQDQNSKQSIIIPDDFPNGFQGTNAISTTQTSPLTFIPTNILKQLSEASNIYFLFIGVLQMIPKMSYTNGFPVVYIPLSIVILAGMIKDGIEELQRFRSDSKENNMTVLRYNMFTNSFEERKWRQLSSGDIIKLKDEQLLPCDIIVLSTNSEQGIAYVETKSLDGESNLKQKYSLSTLHPNFNIQNIKTFKNESIKFTFDSPNPQMYKFNGNYQHSGSDQLGSITYNNFIERGCIMKNTEWLVGLCVFTGGDCKIMLNSSKPHVKRSNLEKKLNLCIYWIVIVLVVFCLFAAFYNIIWTNYHTEVKYLMLVGEYHYYLEILVRLGLWFSLLSYFIPISLLINLDVVKLLQASMISRDLQMMDGKQVSQVNSSNLLEQLGCIDYIFTDKTGTLTQNSMKFQSLITIRDGVAHEYKENLPHTDQDIHYCLQCMTLCHGVVLNQEGKKMGSSPDEIALLDFAEGSGWEYQGIDNAQVITIRENNLTFSKYRVDATFEFTSAQKRMTVIITELKNNTHMVYSKGADEIMMKRIHTRDSTQINQSLKDCSLKGLRTLVLACRFLNDYEYDQIMSKYNSISKEDSQALLLLQNECERDMMFLGITSVEDLLSPKVEETIETLKNAGIKIWVLTGDKLETAVSIGYSTKLLDSQSKLYTFDNESFQKIEQKLMLLINENDPHLSIVISGFSLSTILENAQLEKSFLKIAINAKSVIVCRVSPKQKQQVVKSVQTYLPKKVALSIGDGANDVSMITEASVGVGIQGVEGSQASRSADFSIPSFRMLTRLLFYYGAECQRKNSLLVLYIFYKNLLFITPFFWFGFMNGFSGQIIYEAMLTQFYNIIFTSAPQIFFCVFDERYPTSTILEVNKKSQNHLELKPKYYKDQREKPYFSYTHLVFQFLLANFHGFLLTYQTFYIVSNTWSVNSQGKTLSLFDTGAIIYALAILVANLKLFLYSYTNYPLGICMIFGGPLAYIIIIVLIGLQPQEDVFNIFTVVFNNFNIIFVVILAVSSTYLIELAMERFKYFQTQQANQRSKVKIVNL